MPTFLDELPPVTMATEPRGSTAVSNHTHNICSDNNAAGVCHSSRLVQSLIIEYYKRDRKCSYVTSQNMLISLKSHTDVTNITVRPATLVSKSNK